MGAPDGGRSRATALSKGINAVTTQQTDYDVLIAGQGAAGFAAALYAARYQMRAIVVGERFGGETATGGNVDLNSLDPNDPEAVDDARGMELKQGGIAPRPTFLFPSPADPENCQGEECAPPPVGCVGVECFDPGFANNPVRTLWTQDGVQ